jgi:mono/diheme cytochrome c family protein
MKAATISFTIFVISAAVLIGWIEAKNSDQTPDGAKGELVPGLIARYYSAAVGQEPACVRIDPGVAFDWTDGMPDDRLPAGGFRVIWEGVLRVPYSAKYAFSARAEGPVRIWVRQREVFSTSSAGRFAPLPLEGDDLPIRIEYDAPAAKAKIQLIWSGDSFPAEIINPRYLAHRKTAESDAGEAVLVERGREVVERYGCARCHPIAGVDRMRKPGLPMPHVAHMNPEWIVRWVRDPQSVRPGTRMGTPGGKPEEVEAIVTSLLSLVQLCDSYGLIDSRWRCGQADDPLDHGDISGLASAGRKRFYELGCSACHAPETPELNDPTRGPSLADIGTKWCKAYLRQIMLDPVARHPSGGMPSNVLERGDVDALVAYMSTFRLKPADDSRPIPKTFTAPPVIHLRPGQTLFDPEVCKKEKAPIRQRFCYACHSPENTPVDAHKIDPATARWDAGCLRADRAASFAPQFALSPSDRAAVIAFLRSRPKKAAAVASGELAQRFIDQTVYCFACHKRDGRGGESLARTLEHYRPASASTGPATPDPLSAPDLSGVGARLVRPWMLEVLTGKAPSNRPWLKTKMPGFGLSEADRLRIAARLAFADEIPQLAMPRMTPVTGASEATAATLISNRGFNCLGCHFRGAKSLQPSSYAPDFTMAARRVNHAWFDRWLSSPARIIPTTPMPPIDVPIPGVADGDLATQKEILWRFLQREATRTDDKPAAVK